MEDLDEEYVYDPGVPWRAHAAFMRADISCYVRHWENHIRHEKKRRKERIRREQHLGEDNDGGGIRSDNDKDDEDGCKDGAGTKGQHCEQRDDDKDTEEAEDARTGDLDSTNGDAKPVVKDRVNRELAKLCRALAFSSDVQVKRKLQGRGSAVVSELDTRRYVLHKKPDVHAPRLYNIDVPTATLFTNKDGKPFCQPGDRRPAHARLNDSSDEDGQPRDQDDENRLLRM